MSLSRFVAVLIVSSLVGVAGAADEAQFEPLFNGKDFTGLETWLAVPLGETEILGEKDPQHVFTVEDGCIHISGQTFGAVTTKDSFSNFHLRLEQKWGTKKWPPRDNVVRDSGILYYATGPHGAIFKGAWKSSVECQVQEGEIGDIYTLGNLVDVHAEKQQLVFAQPPGKIVEGWQYSPEAELQKGINGRVNRMLTMDKPNGQWNMIEIICRNGICISLVNGTKVNELQNPMRKVGDKYESMTTGQIQLQSEGAEVWYRHIELKKLN